MFLGQKMLHFFALVLPLMVYPSFGDQNVAVCYTDWESQDTPAGCGDYELAETSLVFCTGANVGIQCRSIDLLYSFPTIPNQLSPSFNCSASSGLLCLKYVPGTCSDGTESSCEDYEVRYLCLYSHINTTCGQGQNPFNTSITDSPSRSPTISPTSPTMSPTSPTRSSTTSTTTAAPTVRPTFSPLNKNVKKIEGNSSNGPSLSLLTTIAIISGVGCPIVCCIVVLACFQFMKLRQIEKSNDGENVNDRRRTRSSSSFSPPSSTRNRSRSGTSSGGGGGRGRRSSRASRRQSVKLQYDRPPKPLSLVTATPIPSNYEDYSNTPVYKSLELQRYGQSPGAVGVYDDVTGATLQNYTIPKHKATELQFEQQSLYGKSPGGIGIYGAEQKKEEYASLAVNAQRHDDTGYGRSPNAAGVYFDTKE